MNDLLDDTLARAGAVLGEDPELTSSLRDLASDRAGRGQRPRRRIRWSIGIGERVAAAITVARMPDDAEVLDVRAAVDPLPTELAELVRLVHWDGFVEEAAAHLGVPASTARSRHARAKQLLRQTLHLLEAAGP